MNPKSAVDANPGAPPTGGPEPVRGDLIEGDDAIHALLNALVLDPFDSDSFVTLSKVLSKRLGIEHCWLFLLSRNCPAAQWLTPPAGVDPGRIGAWLARADRSPGLAFIDDVEPALRILPLGNPPGSSGGLVLAGHTDLESDQVLVEYLAPRLSEICSNVGRARLFRKREQYDERAAISRELHDSLAQSLTYLKIQVTRLRASVPRSADPDSTDQALMPAIEELQSTLATAYRQLRELMTTFRLTMHGRTFNEAVDESVMEFAERSTVAIELDNRIPADCLSVDEEMQLLQVIREGLSNIVRHSHARRAKVQIRDEQGGSILLSVKDDGVGLDGEDARLRHHGLVIMQERTHRLGGAFSVTTGDQGGTVINCRFKPRGRLSTRAG